MSGCGLSHDSEENDYKSIWVKGTGNIIMVRLKDTLQLTKLTVVCLQLKFYQLCNSPR